MLIQMSQSTLTIKDYTGGSRSQGANMSPFSANGASGSVIKGIILGTSDTSPAINDYKIGTLIAHGTSAGQLEYGTTSFTSVSIVGSAAKFTITRSVTNNSGSAIDVEEVALYIAGDFNYMIEHSLLPFTVDNLLTATVTYTLSVTV
jgi:hypothetical protein